MQTLRLLVRRIRNLIYWLPVIWRDEHWDQSYLYRIMGHKIAAMLEHTTGCVMGREDEVPEQYRQAVRLLSDLAEGRYEYDAFATHIKIFGASDWRSFPSEEHPEFDSVEITYPEAEDQELAKRALMSFGRMADLNNRIALDALGELIKLSDRWWD